jgi:hypothetical protein
VVPVPKEHLLVSFKAYFDGAGEANTNLYKVLTLAALCGSGIQWAHFTEQWGRVLSSHPLKPEFLHVTDAVNLKAEFSEEKGWSKQAVDELMNSCVTIIERCVATRKGDHFSFIGIRPVTITVALDDFKRALKKIPELSAVHQVCVLQALVRCMTWGKANGYSKIELHFDQNERFRGHLLERQKHKRVRRDAPALLNIVSNGEADMRFVPALQATDVLAWSVHHKYEDGHCRYEWQERILAIDRDDELLKYARLCNPSTRAIKALKDWNLPRRRPIS